MLHAIFPRPNQEIKLFSFGAPSPLAVYRGEGDTWGDNPNKYGFEGWCPPGHYMLGAPQMFDAPITSEGFGQIPVLDLDQQTVKDLAGAGKLVIESNGKATIGGINLPLYQLAVYNRSAIMIHGGGSNAPQPLADYQELCKTEGCTRTFNAQWKDLASRLTPAVMASNVVIFSIIGDPVILPC